MNSRMSICPEAEACCQRTKFSFSWFDTFSWEAMDASTAEKPNEEIVFSLG